MKKQIGQRMNVQLMQLFSELRANALELGELA
jgi:hypothetical protein